jgi:site-specific recombinase XerD
MQLSRAVQEFIDEVKRQQKARATVDNYRSDLARLSALAGRDTILKFTPEIIRRYFDLASEDGNRPATLHRKSAVIREFIRWGAKQRLWDGLLLLDAVPKIRRPETLPRPFARDEIARLWALPLPAEERVLRALLFFTGLRVSAIARLLVGDISEDPPTLRTVTKGSKTVLKHMHPTLATEVLGYLRTHERRGRPQDFLFRKPNGKVVARRELEEITHRWGATARVPACLPHRFRHSFATSMLEGGADIRIIGEWLDHADLKSTKIYTRVSDERLQDAMLRLPASWGTTLPASSESSGPVTDA